MTQCPVTERRKSDWGLLPIKKPQILPVGLLWFYLCSSHKQAKKKKKWWDLGEVFERKWCLLVGWYSYKRLVSRSTLCLVFGSWEGEATTSCIHVDFILWNGRKAVSAQKLNEPLPEDEKLPLLFISVLMIEDSQQTASKGFTGAVTTSRYFHFHSRLSNKSSKKKKKNCSPEQPAE